MISRLYLRGAILMLSALVAMAVIVTNVLTQALAIVDRNNRLAELIRVSSSLKPLNSPRDEGI